MNCDNKSNENHEPNMGNGPDINYIKAEPENCKRSLPYEFAALFLAIGLFLGFIFAVLTIRH